jgi:hypothetical protein
MSSLASSIASWLKALPERGPELKRSSALMSNPLYRCLEREAKVGSEVLSRYFPNFFFLPLN